MAWETELAMTERVARNLRLGFSVVSEGDALPMLDLGLRELLEVDWERYFQYFQISESMEERTIYRIRDPFYCQYFALRLPPSEEGERKRAVMVGPYTSAPVSREMIEGFLAGHGAAGQLLPHVETFFTSVPVLYDDGALMAVMDALGEALWGRDNYNVVWEDRPGPDREYSALSGEEKTEGEMAAFDARVLEDRYAAENQLLSAVSQGKTHDAERVLNAFFRTSPEQRAEDPVREWKNCLIVANTLMRKAAEQGGVHPLYLDQTSGRFARRIEEIGRSQECGSLLRTMVHQYCRLVRERSTRAYSLPVQRLILAIDSDLTADLGLSAQARQLGMNPSYLSDLFRRETGVPYTEYVNRRRVERGAILLRTTTRQVQAIAQQCGVCDVNYFNRLCKKYLGCTPSQYRRG